MRAAVLRDYGAAPQADDFEDPAGGEDREVVEVLAAGLNPVDLSVASGSFYGGSPDLPYVVGREGIGRRGDGQRVYFDAPVAPFGSFAQRVAIDPDSAVAIPDGLDEALAVCFGIAGLAGWLALEWRAQLAEGESVLVLGASGVVGQIAVQAARLLGAGRVVGAARGPKGLDRARELGADAVVRLGEVDALAGALRDAQPDGFDVVVDPVWGEPAAAAIEATAPRARVVQIGQSAGSHASIASAAVRGRMLAILGHTNFMTPTKVRQAAYARMVEHAAAGELVVEAERVALDDVAEAWARQAQGVGHKLVIVP